MGDEIRNARKVIRDAMIADPCGFEQGYVANISCLIYDKLHKINHRLSMKHTNEIAHEVVHMIFFQDACPDDSDVSNQQPRNQMTITEKIEKKAQ